MNIENINKLITYLKALPPERFDMASWLSVNGRERYDEGEPTLQDHIRSHPCGTVGCIAGHTYTMAVLEGKPIFGSPYAVYNIAQDYLELPDDTSRRLFMPEFFHGQTYSSVTPAMAVKVLEHLRDTGHVAWSIIA